MKLNLINQEVENWSKDQLSAFYKDQKIPAEKKPFLSDLKNSLGAYMAVESSDQSTFYFQDAASQIATLGLGLNPTALFGTAQYLEAWTNNVKSPLTGTIRQTYEDFFQRKLGWHGLSSRFCHSGAEANEIALGLCYAKRNYPDANKVLAFEGSFHGRMQVSLSATWNPSKRGPFEWAGYLAEYCCFPTDPTAQINAPVPSGWHEFWDQSSAVKFNIGPTWQNDPLMAQEILSLVAVREKLLTKKIFAIIIEPMQCEGGDRYATARFYNALTLMAKSFNTPIIFDEVQTGFHLGREFFWHKEFNLTDVAGAPLLPDYLICAKKSQIGIVLAPNNSLANGSDRQEKHAEEYNVSSMIRGYIHALTLDQNHQTILNLEKQIQHFLAQLVNTFSDYMENPRTHGLSFAFDLKNKLFIEKFIAARFPHGLLYYPAGENTLRFRCNLSFKKTDLNFLFSQLTLISENIFLGKEMQIPKHIEIPDRGVQNLYDWHEFFLSNKDALLHGEQLNPSHILKRINQLLNLVKDHSLILIDATNFQLYSKKIHALQVEIYEPVRQTSIAKFQEIAHDPQGIALAIVDSQKNILGISFSSPLKNHPLERGVRKDNDFHNEQALYMLDVTLAKKMRGAGLGKGLKYATYAFAQAHNVEKINGRNRDILAKDMLNINLSLGGHEKFYMPEDYPDFAEHRDVFYYTTNTKWHAPDLYLDDGVQSPAGTMAPPLDFCKDNLAVMINKVCLSNFVSRSYLENFNYCLELLPKGLQHGYATSGQSECVDKLVKTLWYTTKKSHKLLTFEGHFFGAGSFLARSLSQEDPYFPVVKLPAPNAENWQEILRKLEDEFAIEAPLGVWIEPIMQKTYAKVPRDFLVNLKQLCEKNAVPLIYNETASGNYRYGATFFATNDEAIAPDAGMLYMGGQAGLVYTAKKYFIEKPLMLISTWDGDELSLSRYVAATKFLQQNKEDYFKTRKEFSQKINELINTYRLSSAASWPGFGQIIGDLPYSLKKHFRHTGNRHYFMPAYATMKHYNKKGFS